MLQFSKAANSRLDDVNQQGEALIEFTREENIRHADS